MPARLGLGPVFAYEWILAARRWHLYAIRAGFVCAILAGMIFIFSAEMARGGLGTTVAWNELARFGQRLYVTIVSIELVVVLLVAPAATAGAVCLDKARGTLDHMLVTDLSNAEIVLGKLGVRLGPVLGLVACVLPLMAICSLLGGIDPDAVFGSFLTAIGSGVLACALALALSVWGRKTPEVLMLTYLIIILWIFSRYVVTSLWHTIGTTSLFFYLPALAAWIDATNPFLLVWAPVVRSGGVSLADHFAFLALCLVISGVLVGAATLRIRAVAQGRFKARPLRVRARGRWPIWGFSRLSLWRLLPGPSLDGNPVCWREWYRSKPSQFMRLVWIVYWGMGIAFVSIAFWNVASGNTNRDMIALMNVFQVGIGLLLLSVNAATSLVEERVRGSLDILLSTPLATRSIVTGKWLGAFRSVPHLLFAPALTTFFLACESGKWFSYLGFVALVLVYCALVVSLGLALATWLKRFERAVALCVLADVLLAIGWPVLVITLLLTSPRAKDHVILPAVMGTPLYGTVFGTMVVAAGPLNMPGEPQNVWAGCIFWIVIHSGFALALFAATVATFDRCLGRMPESGIEWGAAGGLAEEPGGFAQQGHDLTELAQRGPAITGGA